MRENWRSVSSFRFAVASSRLAVGSFRFAGGAGFFAARVRASAMDFYLTPEAWQAANFNLTFIDIHPALT